MPKAGKSFKTAQATEPSHLLSRLYSSFLPIPLILPCPTPIASSSSKSLPIVTHYIYVRPHQPKSKSSSIKPAVLAEEQDKSRDKTLFVANVPVDMGERDLRTLFGRWGVVEDVTFTGGSTGDVLEQAVLGLQDDDSDDIEEEEEDHAQGKEEEEGESRPEPIFQGTARPSLPRRLRPRRRPTLPPSVPDIIPLDPLNPRVQPYSPSGSRCAHITYLDTLPFSRVMSHSLSTPITIPSYASDPSNPTGLEYYLSLHASLRPSLAGVKAFADSSMARFDHLHSLLLSSRAKKQGAGALVDEDGFTVVVRGGRYGRTGGRGHGVGGIGVASKGFEKTLKDKDQPSNTSRGAGELADFYKFQKVDRKKRGEFNPLLLLVHLTDQTSDL